MPVIGVNAVFAETTEAQFDLLMNIQFKVVFLLYASLITVNVLAPGAIETDFGGGAVRDNTHMNSFVASQTALVRVNIAEDIGGVVASLLAEDSRWINAQRIEACGMFLQT